MFTPSPAKQTNVKPASSLFDGDDDDDDDDFFGVASDVNKPVAPSNQAGGNVIVRRTWTVLHIDTIYELHNALYNCILQDTNQRKHLHPKER